MAGHSKWANIRHRKERMDSKRGKAFSRIIKETTVAAKIGGADPASNPRLRLALEKARAANVPNDTLERAIKRGAGLIEGAEYAEIRYEGYGPGGAAVIVDCLTDNKNRALSEVRHAFTKYGGNLAANGAVSYLFSRQGQFLYAPGCEQEKIIETAIENGAGDYQTGDDGSLEITCESADFPALLDALKSANLPPDEADIVMRSSTDTTLSEKDAGQMRRMMAVLEDLDDTQHIYTSAIFDEEEVS